MKKLFIITSVEQTLNAFFLNHLNVLKEKFDITLVSNFNKPHNPKFNQLELIDIKFVRKIHLFSDIFNFFKLFYILIKFRPNLILSVTPKVGAIVSLISFILRIKSVHYFTGQVWKNKSGLMKFFLKRIDIMTSFFSHKILVDSNSQFEYLIKNKINIKRKGKVLLKGSISGVDINKFKPNSDIRLKIRKSLKINKNDVVIIFLGRINQDKGIKELVSTYRNIKNKFNNFSIFLLLVGQEDDKILKYLNIKDSKIIHIPNSDVPANYLNASDIFCLPSKREGFGTSVIEASSCELPIICSNIYGLTDAVQNNKTGILFNIYEENDFEDKLINLICDSNLRSKLGKAGRKRVISDFDSNASSKALLNYLISI